MKILVFDIFEKGQILRPFLGLAPSKLKIFSKMVAYVHIEYSTYQFSEESKGGGPCGTEKSVVLRGLNCIECKFDAFFSFVKIHIEDNERMLGIFIVNIFSFYC